MSNTSRDYVPSNAAQFMFFMINLNQYVQGKLSDWDNIPSARFDELQTAFGTFQTAFQAASEAPTPANRNTRNEAQAECTRILRAFVNQFLRFPPVTNSDRIEMGIPNHDTIRTDHKVVTEEVENNVQPDGIRTLAVHFKILGAANNAKPHGYDGAVTVWHVADEKPLTPDEYKHHQMASRTPFRINFDEAERGKKVWIMQCWQNERGITGRWSEALFAFIP